MTDPRDKRFFALWKKDDSQLSEDEVRELIGYCDKMLAESLDKKSRRSWTDWKARLTALLPPD